MRTFKLTASIFSVLLAVFAAVLLLNRIFLTVNAGATADRDFWVLVLILGFAAYNTARTIRLIQDKPALVQGPVSITLGEKR